MEYKVFIGRKLDINGDDDARCMVEGLRIRRGLADHDCLGVIILNTDFELTIQRVKRIERWLSSIFEEKVTVIY